MFQTSYLLTQTAFQPLYGRFSDIFGRKTATLFASFTFGLGWCVMESYLFEENSPFIFPAYCVVFPETFGNCVLHELLLELAAVA